MQTCKPIFIQLIFLSAFPLFSQPVPPTAPKGPGGTSTTISTDIKMPSMPQVSMPTMSSGLYTPSISNPGRKNNQTAPQTQTEIPQTQNSPAQTVLNTTIQNQAGDLTAQDLTTMAERGLITNISSIFQGTAANLNSLLTPSQSQNADSNQTALLNQILTELNTIKNNQANLQTKNTVKTMSSSTAPALLRFVINNQDFLSSCSAVYISKPESDGTFLLTGDCRTLVNSKPQTETFYVLFKADGAQEGRTVYNVTSSITQSTPNPYTPLYKFCSIQNQKALKTGNIVSFVINQDGTRSDMLLDIDK